MVGQLLHLHYVCAYSIFLHLLCVVFNVRVSSNFVSLYIHCVPKKYTPWCLTITLAGRVAVFVYIHREFSHEPVGERILKIGPHCWSYYQTLRGILFWGDTVYIHCVPKKHVTTFLMISWSRTVRLERFLAHLLLRVQAIDRYFLFFHLTYFVQLLIQDLNISKN